MAPFLDLINLVQLLLVCLLEGGLLVALKSAVVEDGAFLPFVVSLEK
jgi:hypothetical protein